MLKREVERVRNHVRCLVVRQTLTAHTLPLLTGCVFHISLVAAIYRLYIYIQSAVPLWDASVYFLAAVCWMYFFKMSMLALLGFLRLLTTRSIHVSNVSAPA